MTNSEDRPPAQEPATTKTFNTLAAQDSDPADGNANGSRFVRSGPDIAERRAAWRRRQWPHDLKVHRRVAGELDVLARHDVQPLVDVTDPDPWADLALGWRERCAAAQREQSAAAA